MEIREFILYPDPENQPQKLTGIVSALLLRLNPVGAGLESRLAVAVGTNFVCGIEFSQMEATAMGTW